MPGGIRRNISDRLRRLLLLSISDAAILAEAVRTGVGRAALRPEGSRRNHRSPQMASVPERRKPSKALFLEPLEPYRRAHCRADLRIRGARCEHARVRLLRWIRFWAGCPKPSAMRWRCAIASISSRSISTPARTWSRARPERMDSHAPALRTDGFAGSVSGRLHGGPRAASAGPAV